MTITDGSTTETWTRTFSVTNRCANANLIGSLTPDAVGEQLTYTVGATALSTSFTEATYSWTSGGTWTCDVTYTPIYTTTNVGSIVSYNDDGR